MNLHREILDELRGAPKPSDDMTKIPRTAPVVRAILDYAAEENRRRLVSHRLLVRRLCRE